ncbi:MAG: hypothetical protein QOF76_1868 [Solirubrobacteraceae bacterium]|jgi:DNA-binding MarR family transcriptional regulator|nr:hypothetical protein [Solirubrobacteraceae bacterium]
MPAIAPKIDPSEPFTEQELAAWRGLLLLHAQVTQALDAQMRAEHDLSLSVYEVLMFLGDADGKRLRMTEIANRVLLSRSGLTRLVDRLVELGYVTRCASENDKRGLYAELTAAGAKKLESARRTHREGVRQFFLDHLSTTDEVVLGDVISRFLATARP